MRMAPKYIQALCTNVLQATTGVHSDCCLVRIAVIINEQCEKIKAALQKKGINMKYAMYPCRKSTCQDASHANQMFPNVTGWWNSQ